MDLKEALKEKGADQLIEDFKRQIEEAQEELKAEQERLNEEKKIEAKNNFVLAAMDYLVAYGIIDENEENNEIISYMCQYIETLEQSLSKYSAANSKINKWISKLTS